MYYIGEVMKIKHVLLSAFMIGVLPLGVFAAPAKAPVAAKANTVAVVNFSNLTNDRSLQSLAKSLPETVSAVLSQSKDIRVVEREQLGKVVDEIALSQTGALEGDQTTFRLLKADILVIGSYSGNEENLTLTIKAVQVTTGKVLYGKVVQTNYSRITNTATMQARIISATLSGKPLGGLTVMSTPDGAAVYIDGDEVGRTPLPEYKLPEGKYKVLVVREGYVENSTSVTIEPGKTERWSALLMENKLVDRSYVALSVGRYMPVNKHIDGAMSFAFTVGQSFDRFVLAADAMYVKLPCNSVYSSPFGDVTRERYYDYFQIAGSISVVIFPYWNYFQPYVGIFTSIGRLQEYQKKTTASGGEKSYGDAQYPWIIGPQVGIHFLPRSRVGLFAEGRFSYCTKKLTRDEYQQTLAGTTTTPGDFSFNSFSISGGVRLYF